MKNQNQSTILRQKALTLTVLFGSAGVIGDVSGYPVLFLGRQA